SDKRTPDQVQRLREHFASQFGVDFVADVRRLAALRMEREKAEKAIPLALVWQEMNPPRPAQLLARGDYREKRDTVERNTPAIFPPLPSDLPRDRLALARWLISSNHPLTARVAVNRLWKQFFGAGLVRTPED